MKDDVYIKNGISIPADEIKFKVSRSGGPGGQHVNRTESKVSVYWNIKNTRILTDEQKLRVLNNIHTHVTDDGVLVIHNCESRSQQQNKQAALATLATVIRKALYIPKKRMKTKVPKNIKEARLREKSHRSSLKKLRTKKIIED
jgi:ribosome-associated protein